MHKGSEMTIKNYTVTLIMINFTESTLFVNDNERSFSCFAHNLVVINH